MPIDTSALGAVLDIHSGDNNDKAGREAWESHMWLHRRAVTSRHDWLTCFQYFNPLAPVMIRESDSFCSDTQDKIG